MLKCEELCIYKRRCRDVELFYDFIEVRLKELEKAFEGIEKKYDDIKENKFGDSCVDMIDLQLRYAKMYVEDIRTINENIIKKR